MAKMTSFTSILLVSKNPSLIKATNSTLSKDGFLKLIERETSWENLFPIIAETEPDVILFDYEFSHHPFYLIDKIASEYPSSVLVTILPESQVTKSDQVVLSGARAFVLFPYRSDNLILTIRRMEELAGRNRQVPSLPLPSSEVKPTVKNIFTVFSPKGGVGCTTVATNLAISLQKALKEDVLLIDGKHLFGHVALYLNLRTGNSINDLITHAGMLDQGLIRQVVVKHISGIHVLPSPISISEGQGIRPESLYAVIQSLTQMYPNIIIDAGNTLNENTVTYMDSSDKILLVLNPDLASMRDVRQFLEITATLSYPKEKTLLILNQSGRKADVKKDEIESILKMDIFGRIPADENLALSSLNEGVPIILKSPHNSVSKAYNAISKELVKIIKNTKSESHGFS